MFLLIVVSKYYTLSIPAKANINSNLFCSPAPTLKLCGRSGQTMYALLLSATFLPYRQLGLVSGLLPWTSSELCGFWWALLDAGKCCQMPLFMPLMCCRLRHQVPLARRKCVLLVQVNCRSKSFLVCSIWSIKRRKVLFWNRINTWFEQIIQ